MRRRKGGRGDDTADKILGIEEKKPPRRGLGKTSISQGPQTQFARHRSGDRTRDVCGCTAGREYLRWSQRLVWRRDRERERERERERYGWYPVTVFSSPPTRKKTLFAFPGGGTFLSFFPLPPIHPYPLSRAPCRSSLGSGIRVVSLSAFSLAEFLLFQGWQEKGLWIWDSLGVTSESTNGEIFHLDFWLPSSESGVVLLLSLSFL